MNTDKTNAIVQGGGNTNAGGFDVTGHGRGFPDAGGAPYLTSTLGVPLHFTSRTRCCTRSTVNRDPHTWTVDDLAALVI